MKLVIAGNYRVGSGKMNSTDFTTEFHYGMRSGQGVPMKCPKTGEPVLNRTNPAFQSGLTWGKANRNCRSVQAVESALNAAFSAYAQETEFKQR